MDEPKFWESREWIVPPGLVDYLNRFDALCDVMIWKKPGEKSKPLLIHGQTGVGKSLFVDYFIKKFRTVRLKQTIKFINCAAIPETLLESELFGHEKGSFTGANKIKIGVFEYVNNGVVILEELGEMSKFLQAKLLTAIETRSFSRVGGTTDIPLKGQIIATTNVNLSDFRPDFVYRLDIFSIPPIHERRGDILYYMYNFYPDIVEILTEGAALSLFCYNWPGNVREIERVCNSIKTNIKFARNKNFMNKKNFDFTIKHHTQEQFSSIMKPGRGVSDFQFDKPQTLAKEIIKKGIDIAPIENSLHSFSLGFDCFSSPFKQEKHAKLYPGESVKFNEKIGHINRVVNIHFGLSCAGFCMFCSLFFQDVLTGKDILCLSSNIKHNYLGNSSTRNNTENALSDGLMKKLAAENRLIDFLTFTDIKTKSMIDYFPNYDEQTRQAMIECLKFITGIPTISCEDMTNLSGLYARHRNNKFLAEYFGEETTQNNQEEIPIVDISLDELRILYFETVCNTIGTRFGYKTELAKIAKRTKGRITQVLEKLGLNEKFSNLNFHPQKRLVILKGHNNKHQ
jgi:hypothetical protein